MRPLRGSLRAAAIFAAALALAGCAEATPDAAAELSDEAAIEAPAPVVASADAPPGVAAAPVASVDAAPIDTPPPAAEPPGGPRVYAKARFVWIHAAPVAGSGWVGYLTLGGSVALKGGSEEAARMPGGASCTWYKVEPSGFVCAGGTSATLDPDDPTYVAVKRTAPKTDSPWPFEYGESIGLPRYKTVPTPAEQRATEWDLDEHLDEVRRAREAGSDEAIAAIDKALVGVDLSPAGVGPPALLDPGPAIREARKRIVQGSTVAYTGQFDAEGRTWLLAWDHAIIPKDRVRPYPRSTFEGVEIGEKVSLPIAFFRKKPRPQLRRQGEAIVETGASWPAKSWVALTGERITQGGETLLATREAGLFVRESDATVVDRAAAAPRFRDDGGRHTWLEVSVLGGWLIAYEGETPVFATLISPGRGGLPVPGKAAIETAATPVGTFRVDGKFVTATMVSSTNDLIVHTEVQYVLNFHGPHALHGAYWHDEFGQPKSGGCVNLAPRDAQRIFHWTEPPVPAGWHGMRSIKEAGPATIVIVHR